MADEDLRDFLISQLRDLDGVSARAMFGGHGLYLDDRLFGVISDGGIYFRTDEQSRHEYTARGMRALPPPDRRPRGPRTVDRNFEVPPEVLEDPDELATWARRAAAAER
jgi:DNA transformation protein